ncbi:MAG: ACP phosphodiesterase [Niabella sp.]
MNYLAHAYLSFGNREVLLGNMISDFVKGRKQFLFPDVIHKGILLHRAIDEFTDTHAATRSAKEVFRKEYRLYSGAFIDVVYDHFLANDDLEFTDGSLFDFSQQTYRALNEQQDMMPDPFKRMFFYMRSQNWLYNYRTKSGTHQSFGGLVRRAAYLHDSGAAIKIFEKQYDFLESCYKIFWKELKPFTFDRFKELLALS